MHRRRCQISRITFDIERREKEDAAMGKLKTLATALVAEGKPYAATAQGAL